jgi:hypothetical protein
VTSILYVFKHKSMKVHEGENKWNQVTQLRHLIEKSGQLNAPIALSLGKWCLLHIERWLGELQERVVFSGEEISCLRQKVNTFRLSPARSLDNTPR